MSKRIPPAYYEEKAEQAENEGRWRDAANLWGSAEGVTLGHHKAARYRQREERARLKADEAKREAVQ